ncbi:pseudouridine synthase [Nitzschia inconspicua]|uniref:Pseudouridine synthase n=1 Tax=Nitzschia inconspicua TaxID=303405 RepID=A0A9K3KT03_9STRA|nr:pseudouridine synthase [Nitzschia inconspicua]
MRFALATVVLASAVSEGSSFASRSQVTTKTFGRHSLQHTAGPSIGHKGIYSTMEEQELLVEAGSPMVGVEIVSVQEDEDEELVEVSAQAINARLERQLEKMRLKDQTSKQLSKEDLVIVHEDQNILIVDKPSGVLTVPGKDKGVPSLAKTVYDNIPTLDLPTPDHMVVHRLGMDTSGLIIMAKNKAAVRELNGLFRERKVDRRYEALVAGHVEKDQGMISLPIMRDYERPPFVRISTEQHQWKLVDLTPEEVGRKILEGPKQSLTKYEVVSREFLSGQPVTRVTLTSISGRYHQLNVHLAAFGHPIVGDNVYGTNGEALPNGGLRDEELETLIPNPNRATAEEQRLLNEIVHANDMPPCVHAKYIKFTHPKTKKVHEFSTKSPF